MRKIFAVLCSYIAICALFVACDNLVSKVQIKASPALYAPLGKKSLEVKEYLSAEKIAEMLGNSDSGLKVYDYTAGAEDDAMAFLVYYPVLDMDLDFSSYMENLDMDSLSSTIPEISFAVPSLDSISVEPQVVAIDGTEDYAGVPLDANSAQLLNSMMPAAGVPLTVEKRTISITGEGLESVTFANGCKVILELEPTLDTLTCEPDLYMVLQDGTSVKFEKSADGTTYEADFSGKTISPGEIDISGSVTVSGSVSAGQVMPEEGLGATISIKTAFGDGFDSVTAEVPADTQLSDTVSYDLPEKVTSMISKISFTNAGARLSVDSNLPSGNDIKITVNSSAFKLDNVSKTLVSGADTITELEFLSGAFDFVPASQPTISLDMTVELPGYDTASNTITVKDILPGETYKISGNVDVVTDWTAVTVKSDGYEGTYPEDGSEPIDMSDFTDKIPEGISFKNIAGNMYLTSPADTFSLKGKVLANSTYLLGSADEAATITKSDALQFPAEGFTEWSEDLPVAAVEFGEKMTEFVNSRPEQLSLSYSLVADEITLSKEDLNSSTNIKVELVVVLPVELEINGDELPDGAQEGMKYVKFDVFELADVYSDEPDANNDLFGRDEPPQQSEEDEEDEIEELLSQVESMTLAVEFDNQLGFATMAEFSDTASGIKQVFSLGKGSGNVEIKLDSEDVTRIKDSYPFSPRVYVYLPNTTEEEPFMLKKNAKLEMKVSVSAVTDIDYTYDFGGGE